MSFAPQGGVSEASASRSSHPFRRSSGRNGTSERKREREVSERPASSITSSGHRLSPPSCDHGGMREPKAWKWVRTDMKEVNLGFHGRFLPYIPIPFVPVHPVHSVRHVGRYTSPTSPGTARERDEWVTWWGKGWVWGLRVGLGCEGRVTDSLRGEAVRGMKGVSHSRRWNRSL